MRAPRTLRVRLTLCTVGGALLCGLIMQTVLLAEVESSGRDAVDRGLRERAANISPPGGFRGRHDRSDADDRGSQAPASPQSDGPTTPRERAPGSNGDGDGPEHGALGPPPGLLAGSGTFGQMSTGGRITQQAGDVPADRLAVPARDGLATVTLADEPWRVLTLSRRSISGVRERVQLASTLQPLEDRVDSLQRLVLLLGIGALVLVALATWVITTLSLRSLERLRAGAERVSGAEDLATPLAQDEGPDEVRAVARALNAMLGRLAASADELQRALLATRRFAADAGHELRTPLTGLRANLDALERNPDLPAAERDALLADAVAAQDRTVHLLAGLQALARGEAAESLPRADVGLADLLDAAVYAARRRHSETTFTLEIDDAAAEVTTHGWEGGLRLLVDNLLDNAALHGRAGGAIWASLAVDGDRARLRVEDDGPGIPPNDRERLLEPFARGAESNAPGTGLGLAIVAQQVALHDGDLHLDEAPLGGLAVTVRLPATDVRTPARQRPIPL